MHHPADRLRGYKQRERRTKGPLGDKIQEIKRKRPAREPGPQENAYAERGPSEWLARLREEMQRCAEDHGNSRPRWRIESAFRGNSSLVMGSTTKERSGKKECNAATCGQVELLNKERKAPSAGRPSAKRGVQLGRSEVWGRPG